MNEKNKILAGKLTLCTASVLLGMGLVGAAGHTANAARLSGTVHVNRVANHPTWKILLWDGQGRGTGKYINGNTNWKVFEKKAINGKDYYRLGTDQQWVQAQYVDASNAVETQVRAIFTVGNSPVQLVDGQGQQTSATLPAGSAWKAFAQKTINGQVYYRLGTDRQWAPANGGSLDGTVPDVSNNSSNGSTTPSAPVTPTNPDQPADTFSVKLPATLSKVSEDDVDDTMLGETSQAVVLQALSKANDNATFTNVNSTPNTNGQVEFKRGKVLVYFGDKLNVINNSQLVEHSATPDQPTTPVTPTPSDDFERAGFSYPAAPIELNLAPNTPMTVTQQNQIVDALKATNSNLSSLERVNRLDGDNEIMFGGYFGDHPYARLQYNGKTYDLNVAKLYK